jgi:hypothetical protein
MFHTYAKYGPVLGTEPLPCDPEVYHFGRYSCSIILGYCRLLICPFLAVLAPSLRPKGYRSPGCTVIKVLSIFNSNI